MADRDGKGAPSTDGKALRVLIVGKSEIVGQRVHRVLDPEPGFEVIGHVPDGISAVSILRSQSVDAVILDIGDNAINVKVTLARMFRIDPALKVITSASLTFENVKKSMDAMLNGAAEFLNVPAQHTKVTSNSVYGRKLIDSIRAFGHSNRAPGEALSPSGRPKSSKTSGPETFTLRQAPVLRPKIVAIGSSTGGPQALFNFLRDLPPGFSLPILITQHMPPTFTAILAEHITKNSSLRCAEADDGEQVVGGRIYLAPGDFHMLVEKKNGVPTIALNQDPPVNYCRPAVDPMFDSIAKVYGGNVIAAILTGMGSDGLNGSKTIVAAGGTVLAQDEDSSVVWGMPRAVALAGICSAVLPVPELSRRMMDMIDKAG